jgi:hypothetical protein
VNFMLGFIIGSVAVGVIYWLRLSEEEKLR